MPKDLRRRLDNLRHQADWIGVREVKETVKYGVALNGKLDRHATSMDHGLMVEVLVDGQFAYSATADLSEQALQAACDRATSLAQQMSAWKIYPFTSDHRALASGEYRSVASTPISQSNSGEIMGMLIDATTKMKVSDKIVNCLAHASMSEKVTTMVSSSGSQLQQVVSSVASNLTATAQEGPEIQTRSTGLPCFQGGLELLNRDVIHSEAERVGRESLELLQAEQCPTGVYDLILAPDQLYLQVHESIGHPLELDRILGDERNYAGWSFINPADFGQLQYGSPLLNVVFDPKVVGEYASYAFDDTGLPAERQYLIKNGLLVRGIGGIDSQKRLGLPGIACTRSSSWNRPPIDRIANINIEPGDTSLDQMISGVERGVYMTTNNSWSIDDYRNKFQFGCEYARLIENGKLTKILKNPNYRGITTSFWKNLKQVGDPSTFEVWGSPYCGKGEPNQVISVGHAIPTCLFGNIEIFGGSA
jgi:predicted Zn-dependent protease